MRTMQEIVADYVVDEAKLKPYTLPSPLDKPDGTRVSTAFEWVNFQRRNILQLFKTEVYGEIVPSPDSVSFELLSRRDDALGNTAVRKEIRLHFGMNNGRKHSADMLLYIPKNAAKPVPVFLGLNFKGNHATTDEEDVRKTGFRVPGELVHPDARGEQTCRWCFKEVVARGYASATLCYHDLYPDFKDSAGNSVYRLFFEPSGMASLPDRYTPIGAWAFGLSRMLDYLETDPEADASRTVVHGHSRLGKTALWAGAIDTRFKITVSNNSGCGGAALHKRKFGENVEALISHDCADWFVTAFHKYSGREEDMPFDQHELIALLAPRPVCVASATEDIHADPKGEFLSCVHASEVYRLFGAKGLPVTEMPPPDTPVTGDISYHIRTGVHDQTREDWQHYLDLADLYFR
ncbi:MAG: hypothetical protein BWY31_03788 [Lentisphaerae bacterium ADurb.Bin242]|nr:MAG: hypothetical protein BWY31_03788 [Lentisphaerae bacterium ADurb.Bin242]